MVVVLPSKKEFSLYIHLPFCKKKCGYCHFYVTRDDEAAKEALLEAIALHWHAIKEKCKGRKLVSLYFGGGTPTLLSPKQIGKLVELIALDYDLSGVEITLESNPETMTPAAALGYKAVGINRMSFGLQSLDDGELKQLTREHSGERGEEAVVTAFNAGIEEITVDLMYDVPGQTLASWKRTLQRAVELPITHLSLYNLTIEPKTAFSRQRERLQALCPSDELSAEMYREAVTTLEEGGLKQYEVSAFAKSGSYSRHNSGYWLGRSFLGLGPSAFSDWDGRRFQQVADLKRYCSEVKSAGDATTFSEELPLKERSRELLAIGLRLKQGLSLKRFEERGALVDEEVRAALKHLVTIGLLQTADGDTHALTERGFLFYDEVATLLV